MAKFLEERSCECCVLVYMILAEMYMYMRMHVNSSKR